MSSRPTTPELGAIADALRTHDRFLLVTHENPDGDALGSILGLKRGLDTLGKDCVMFLGGDTGIPQDLTFLPLEELQRELPADATERVLVALDCATEKRMGFDLELLERFPLALDIDHHHDNTEFGRINLVVPEASSTGEIVCDVLHELGIELTPEIAEPLYVAIVTDTGRWQYSNTTPRAMRLGAELVEAGADIRRVFQGIYESVAFAHLKLLGKALDHAQVYEGGRLVGTFLVREDFTELGVGEEYAEGIIDYLRAVDGALMAFTIREPPEPPDAARRMSMRSSSDELDVSAIARKRGGGGHARAAGFSSHDSIDEIIEFIRSEFVAAVGAPASA
jgi:bifunctional oligoribonuclease and PAP phosphatase NrnA